jgi:prepilin-type N-terminal cleavage/methylation domain-containing protein
MKFHIKNQQSDLEVNKGFTLIEVLVAAAIMSIVVALAGTAFVGILKQNRTAEFESERRTNLNRALDYIANEVRMATSVTSMAATSPTTTFPAVTISSGTGVLRLRIPVPNPENGSVYNSRLYTVVYYRANSWTGWESPNSIWRYSNVRNPVPIRTVSPFVTPTPNVVATVPSASPTSATTFDHNFLVDGIQAPQRSGNPLSCPNGTIWDSVASACKPNCPTGSTLTGDNGFYACIYTSGKQVDIYLYGKLSNTSNETMEVKTTVFTRGS